jgi:hypothetical protein
MTPTPPAVTSGLFEAAPQVWQGLARCLSSAALWADHRSVLPEEDSAMAMARITSRLRRPLRDALSHPVGALRRLLGRRRAREE